MNRLDVTEKIISTKVSKGIKWSDVADKVGLSKEWVTAGCLGQMTFDAKQAKIIGKIFGLSADEIKWLQVVPLHGRQQSRQCGPVTFLKSHPHIEQGLICRIVFWGGPAPRAGRGCYHETDPPRPAGMLLKCESHH